MYPKLMKYFQHIDLIKNVFRMSHMNIHTLLIRKTTSFKSDKIFEHRLYRRKCQNNQKLYNRNNMIGSQENDNVNSVP